MPRRRAQLTFLKLLAISVMLAGLAAGAYYGGIYIDILRVRWRLPELISKAAAAHGLDPLLVKSVIIEESRMNYRAISHKGAAGLMQIMPAAVEDYCRATGKVVLPEQFYTPEINLDVGCWYLARMLRRFREQKDPVYFALAAYNAGPSNVERWIANSKGLTGEEFLSKIGIRGTRAYVSRIIKRWSLMTQLEAIS